MEASVQNLYSAFALIFGVFVTIASAVITFDKVAEIIHKRAPTNDLKSKIAKHDMKIEEHDKEIKRLSGDMRNTIDNYNSDRQMMLKCLLVLLKNACGDIDKNKLKEVSAELENHLLK